MLPEPSATRLPVWLALAWFALVVVAPLAALLDLALPLSLSPAEREALARATVRGLGLAFAVASAATLLATLLARTIPALVLLASLLLGRFVIAHGILILGLEPGPGAAVATLIANLSVFAAMIVALRLRTRPTALLEAAADLGAGPLLRAVRVDWPHLRPALFAAFVWSFLQALGDVIAFELAGGGHAYTLGLLIRDALIREDAPGRAVVAVAVLVGLALPCAIVIARELGEAEHRRVRPSPPPPTWLRALGWSSFAALISGPAALVLGSHPEGFGPSDRQLLELLGPTLGIAGVVAGLAGAAGFGLAIAIRRLDPRWTLVVTVLTLAPLAIPPSVLGLLSLTAAARVGWSPGVGLTIVALLGPAVSLAFVTARVLIGAIPAALVEAAADLGAGAVDRLRSVWLPLGRPAWIVAAAVVFAWVLGQAAIPAFTSGPGGDTLAVALTIHARAGAMALVRRWSALLVIAALSCVVVVVVATRRRPA